MTTPQKTITERLRARLTDSFAPEELVIEDQSERHRGHGGYREGGETHFHVRIRAEAFNGLSRVARQRLVSKAVAAEMAERVHALALDVSGTGEG